MLQRDEPAPEEWQAFFATHAPRVIALCVDDAFKRPAHDVVTTVDCGRCRYAHCVESSTFFDPATRVAGSSFLPASYCSETLAMDASFMECLDPQSACYCSVCVRAASVVQPMGHGGPASD